MFINYMWSIYNWKWLDLKGSVDKEKPRNFNYDRVRGRTGQESPIVW